MSDSEKPKSLEDQMKSIKYKWQAPLIFWIEWPCEWMSYWLDELAIFDILKRVPRFFALVSVFYGAIFYTTEANVRKTQAEDQQKVKQYQGLKFLSDAQGKPGDGGRKFILEDLNKDKVSLAGIDISMAYLPGLNLVKANLQSANLEEAVLSQANLAGADLSDANFVDANLTRADLSDAKLMGANLAGADLSDAKLMGANLAGADLSDAKLMGANLNGVKFDGANLKGAILDGAIFDWQSIKKAILDEAILDGTSLN